MFYAIFQRGIHNRQMFRFMFQHHANKQIKHRKINDKEVKNTMSLLTQFGTTHLHLGATKSRRKSTSAVLIQQLSANSSFTLKTQDIPVQTSTQELLDLRSHLTILWSVTTPVTYQTSNNKHKDEVTFKYKQLTPCFTTSVQYTRVSNSHKQS